MRLGMSVKLSPPLADVLPLRGGLRAALPGIASSMARSVRDRTAAGRDVAGRSFRRKADGSPSTLRDTGAMVRSFGPQEISDTGFRLAPAKAERRKAVMHQTGRGGPRREWVGVDERQIEAAREAVATAVTGKGQQ